MLIVFLDVISYACLNFDGGLAKPPLELEMNEWLHPIDICGMEIPVYVPTAQYTDVFH